MSETFYKAVRAFGTPIYMVASRPLILHADRAAAPGPCLLAANHESAFDPQLLIAATPRVIYWLSIVELFRRPIGRWFLSGMGAMPLDRSKPDTATVRQIARHLREGKMVGFFPEGGLRHGSASVLRGGEVHDGVVRLAQILNVPVLPCVVLGGAQFRRWQNWLPLRRTRWAVAYGEPLHMPPGPNRKEARAELAESLRQALQALHAEVSAQM